MNDKDLTNEVSKTLGSLDNIEPIEVDPFFYTRLQARLETSTNLFNQKTFQWILAVLVLLLCINVFSYMSLYKQEVEKERLASLEGFANSYGWANYNLYEYK